MTNECKYNEHNSPSKDHKKDRKKDCPKCAFKSFNRCIRCIKCKYRFSKKVRVIKKNNHFKPNYKFKDMITHLNIYQETDTKFICNKLLFI